jgi:hypothetical protein
MACGHCRRRKIRCIPPTSEDPQGRCANCIRLKKECIFVPVDHTSELPKTSSRKEIGSMSTSSTSSPRAEVPLGPSQVPVIPVESQRGPPSDQARVPTAAVLSQAAGDQHLPVSYHPPEPVPNDISPFPPNFAFSQHNDSVPWHQQDGSDQHPLPSPYWGSAETTPNRPNFSPNPLTCLSPQDGYSQNHQPWPPPTRSASLSQIEGAYPPYGYIDTRHGSDFTGLQMQPAMQTTTGPLSSASLTQDASIAPAHHFGPQEHQPMENLPTSGLQPQWVPQGSHGPWFSGPDHITRSQMNAQDTTTIPYTTMPPHFYVNHSHPG